MIEPESLLVAAAVVVWAPPVLDMLLSIVHALVLPPDVGGDRRRGLIVFVEPTRAFGVRWGIRQVAAGPRRIPTAPNGGAVTGAHGGPSDGSSMVVSHPAAGLGRLALLGMGYPPHPLRASAWAASSGRGCR